MKKIIITIAFLALLFPALCQSVTLPQAEKAALAKITAAGMDGGFTICDHTAFPDPSGDDLMFLFRLVPAGYMIIAGNMELPPILAYSFTDDPDKEGRLAGLALEDLSRRMANQPEHLRTQNRKTWADLAENPGKSVFFEQWPAPGTTTTGGWLVTNWTQSAPYNQLCPWDKVTDLRSIAGCPAVAMAQIVNFHETINNVSFSDDDDYHHNYAGRNYYIDNDFFTLDFPSFPTLNKFLDTLQSRYDNETPLANFDKAALIFACGVAATQVFTSSASGTFGVAQAYDAFLKFNFTQSDLLTESDTNLYTKMAQNILDTLPVHLAVVNPGWTVGHNVVVDGYNTEGYFHLNFGWGGASNGWYLLPQQMPYNLTVVEGAIVDIIPGFPTGMAEKTGIRLLISPNPACDKVRLSAGKGYERLELYAADGRLIRSVTLTGTETVVDISNLAAGIYYVRAGGGKEPLSSKLIVRK